MEDFPEEVMSERDLEGFWKEEEKGGEHRGSKRE